ncbi:MAG TPA: condensation domain-containing protein, partial [Pyrinomonadaceae bacterium]|nr:condensation domain-containing protein [Pyrinomonadaceae bacterium]
MTNIIKEISNFSPAQLALLEAALKQAGLEVPHSPIVSRAKDRDLFPLSFAQQRLWYLDQLDPGNTVYNMPFAVRLTGSLDVAALERSLLEIERRHEILRTTFAVKDGHPVQLVADGRVSMLRHVDLRDFAAKREERAGELVAEEAEEPFDLSRGPLLRVKLLRLGAEDYILLLTMHHIVSDGWSTGVLIRELSALYDAYSRGEDSPLAESLIQYADYAVWQREWLQAEVEGQLDYWRTKLADAPAMLELPTDRARPAFQSSRGAAHTIVLPMQLSESLKNLSQGQGTTLFMTLLSAFYVLLYRYSGQQDICVGSPVANRNRAELEGVIGFFVNTLVLRTQVRSEDSFLGLLYHVREATLSAHAHQDVPFEQIVEELQPERTLGRSSLFQVMFNLQNSSAQTLRLGNLRLGPVGAEVKTTKCELVLTLTESEQGLLATMEYSTDLFEVETIGRMLRQYET